MAEAPVRQLIPTAPLSEFGDFPDSAEFNDPHRMDRDHSYVPGFSEMRRARDLKVAEYRNGRCSAQDVPTMPVNLRWARNQKASGAPDSTKLFGHDRKGYRVVTEKDVGQAWLTALPPGSQVQADGSIRNGDTVLMVATAQAAARNEAEKRRQTNERLHGVTSTFEQVMNAAGGAPKGSTPTIQKESTSDPGKTPGRK